MSCIGKIKATANSLFIIIIVVFSLILIVSISTMMGAGNIFDNRGIGNTTSGEDRFFSIAQFANDTAGLLDVLEINEADILGYSMGSVIAQELALSYPDRVGKLVI